MNRFVFGVVCYQQERLVVETLESIRYQVVRYGEGWDVALIITDDGSKDASQKIVSDWVDRRGDVFSSISCLFSNSNRGVVYNYNLILSHIVNEPFKIIAGDDLICSDNLFDKVGRVGYHSIDAYMPLMLRDGKIFLDYYYVNQRFYEMHKSRTRMYDLRMHMRGSYICTPTTLYNIAAYRDSNTISLNEKFVLFEDDPMWYNILNNLEDSHVTFWPDSIVLYRLHDSSISNSTEPNPVFCEEKLKLNQLYMEDSTGFEKAYLVSKTKKHVSKYLCLHKYVDAVRKTKIKLFCITRRKEYQAYCTKIEETVRKEQLFYNKIQSLILR